MSEKYKLDSQSKQECQEMKIIIGDIYYNDAYGKLYEDIEKGEYIKYTFLSSLGLIVVPFIKRPVPWLIDGKQYYDVVTPYGYGGPLIIKSACDTQEIMIAFARSFSAYCKANDIICEFLRFHTLYNNASYCQDIYEVIHNRHTIAIDLTDEAFFENQFSSKCRNMVRKAARNGVITEIDEELKTIDTFSDLYYSTMKKDDADDYYFFNKDYFCKIRDNLADSSLLVNAISEGQIIASSLFLYTPGNFAHYHLSATSPEFYKMAANNLIIKVACDALRERNCTWLHLGGGLSSDSNDSLFSFKHSFGRQEKNLKNFFIGKKVWNEKIYQKTIEQYLRHGGERNSFFPMYRW